MKKQSLESKCGLQVVAFELLSQHLNIGLHINVMLPIHTHTTTGTVLVVQDHRDW